MASQKNPIGTNQKIGAEHRAAIYRELHRDYLDRFNATRRIEWIVNGGLWAGILLVGGRLAGHLDTIFLSWPEIVGASIAVGFMHFILWMLPIARSESADVALANEYRIYTHLALTGEDLTLSHDRSERSTALANAENRFPSRLSPGAGESVVPMKMKYWLWLECGTTSLLLFLSPRLSEKQLVHILHIV